MTRLGNTVEEVKASIEQMAKKDLTELLETEVGVILATNESMLAHDLTCDPKGEWHTNPNTDQKEYITLEDDYPIQDTVFDTYEESPELLEVLNNDVSVTRYHSALLRSRCRVTSQPDSGDVYISFTGSKTVDPISLLKYIVSFRDECHFHEEICEAIYKRLYDLLQPKTLSVKCLYARRGGWDINPERVSHTSLKHYALSDPRQYHIKTPKQ
jgi:7-cyano-7-deazaguanine reductase